MEQYIDKAAIAAEIEKRRSEWQYGSSIEAKYKKEECDDILSSLNTIEVKTVDLDESAMDYKKKYVEALERAKKAKNNASLSNGTLRVLGIIFPELNESEDEKIRKELIRLVYVSYNDLFPYTPTKEEYEEMTAWLEKQVPIDRDKVVKGVRQGVATSLMNYIDANTKGMCLSNMECVDIENAIVSEDWDKVYRYMKKKLEKQCEQKPANKLEPKFKVKYAVGEYNVVDEKDIAGVTYYGIEDEPNHIDYVKADTCEIINAKPKFKVGDYVVTDYIVGKIFAITDDSYLLDTGQGIPFSSNNVHLWTIKDAKDGDVLTVNGRPFIYCCYDDYQGNYCCIDSNGEFRTTFDFGFNGKTILPATNQERDTLFAEMREACYEWDAKKKELKKTEQNQNLAWSEEDECYMTECINAIATKDSWSFEEKRKTKHWLKSLKDRYTWKQSDGQMNNL